jgi:hypothetical protein
MNRTIDQRQQLRSEILSLYRREHAAVGEAGAYRLLDQARQWDLAPVVRAGGVIVFPHAGIAACGHQIAAAVHACLDSGADLVLVISVLHAFTDEMEAARIRVANGGKPSQERFWGIQGSGLPGPRQEWQQDHALMCWCYLYLAGGQPEALPGLAEVEALARNAVIVSTADPFHHGIGYGDPPARALMPEAGGLDAARQSIEEGIELLGSGDYWGYNQHCVTARSDARDAGQLFRYLRGPMQGRIVDLTYSDASELYRQPPPTWVATALLAWEPVG